MPSWFAVFPPYILCATRLSPRSQTEFFIFAASTGNDGAEDPDVYVPSAYAQQGTDSIPIAQAQAVQQQPQTAYAQPRPPQSQMSAAPAVTGPVNMNLGKDPKRITCPYCQQSAVTSTAHTIDACTVIAVVVLLILFWPVFWIREYECDHRWKSNTKISSGSVVSFCTAFVGSCCKSTNHHCGHCHRKVSLFVFSNLCHGCSRGVKTLASQFFSFHCTISVLVQVGTTSAC